MKCSINAVCMEVLNLDTNVDVNALISDCPDRRSCVCHNGESVTANFCAASKCVLPDMLFL